MRFYTANVNIAGDRNHVLVKSGLCAAEIMVLQAIHGPQDVYGIRAEPTSGQDKTPHATIREQLDRKYGRTKIGPDDDRHAVLPRVFPGWPNAKMPADAEAAGIDDALMADEKPARSRKASKSKTAESHGESADDNSFAE